MTKPPDWDLCAYFTAFEAPDYLEFRARFLERVHHLLESARALGGIDDDTMEAWSSFLLEYERLGAEAGHLSSYLGCLFASDVTNEAVQGALAWLDEVWADYQKIEVRVKAAFKAADDTLFERLVARDELGQARYLLARLRQQARFTMEVELEELAADLAVNGFSAWGRLYDRIAGHLEFELRRPDGTVETVPMSMKTTLLEDPDPRVRRAVLEGSNAAWAGVEQTAAASLNALAGTRHTLYRRRGVEHFLDPACFDAGISRRTLEAMLEAMERKTEVSRRYLRLKAGLLGVERLGFQDLAAPLPFKPAAEISWDEGRDRIVAAFGKAYPELADFSEQAFRRRWIDYSPRAGKAPGGFCSGSRVIKESRIFMTYNGTVGDLQTLAHELGHAFHEWVMRDMRPWACDYPMTLAETASTFAESILTDALLADPNLGAGERAALLDTVLERGQAFLLNIPMRFTFESELYERRPEGELPPAELKAMMRRAQERWYGNALDPEQLDPYFWASKLHFYITGISFYNFPYSFGFLFSLGVLGRFQQQGKTFLPNYEELLRLTGSHPAEEVARRALGVDLESPDFWLSSIAVVERDLQRFEKAVSEL